MRYKIEIWIHHNVKEIYESDELSDILKWYKNKWQVSFDFGNCMFYVYDNGKEIEFDELIKLGFYDN